MAQKYLVQNHLEPVAFDEPIPEGQPTVAVCSPQELDTLGFIKADTRFILKNLASVENTYLDVFPIYLIGSFAVPDKSDPHFEPICFAFYLDHTHLVFLDEQNLCAPLLDTIRTQGLLKEPTVIYCLFECIKLLTKNDLTFLARLEDRMEDVEESIIENGADKQTHSMLNARRKLLHINTYYQQLVDMTSGIADNENNLLTHEETRLFLVLERQAERLLKRSQTLKEYSLQLRELYQTQIDIQQNDTMKLFTVITVLFAPLTLIASWFGMNFQNMPGINWDGGYQVIAVLSLTIVVVELIVFKRKKWL